MTKLRQLIEEISLEPEAEKLPAETQKKMHLFVTQLAK